MTTEHHDEKETKDKVIGVQPLTINAVKLVEIEKTVEIPVLKEVEKIVEVPVYVDKKYERPVIKEKDYERPNIVDVEYERPVITEVEKTIEVPVPVEKPYDIPVPNEVPYDLPVVSMKQVKEVAEDATMVLVKAQGLLKEVSAVVEALRATVSEIKEKLPEEIKIPTIIEEDLIVKVPKLEYETKYVIGKIVAREK